MRPDVERILRACVAQRESEGLDRVPGQTELLCLEIKTMRDATYEARSHLGAIRRPNEMILGEMGDKARVVFVGEPFPYDAIWSEDDGWVPYNRKDQSHNGVTPACRVRMNVWCVERHAMYWYEMSAATFRVLLKHRERAPIEGRVFQIERMDSDDACPTYRLDESGVYLAPPNAVRWDLGSCGHLAEMATAEAVRLAGVCSVCGHPKNSGPCQRQHP